MTAPISSLSAPAKLKRAKKIRPAGYVLTLHLKIQPESNNWLNAGAIETNQVWNFSNATRHKAAKPYVGAPTYLSSFALDKLTAGCGEVFEKIGSDVAQQVNKELVTRQKQFARTKLRFRNSFGSKRSLGWIPFKAANLRVNGDRLTFMGKTFRLFQMDRFLQFRNAIGNTLCDGNFAQNALGEWFLNVPVHVLYPTGTVVPVVEKKPKTKGTTKTKVRTASGDKKDSAAKPRLMKNHSPSRCSSHQAPSP
jgi:putative transposase